MSCAEQLGPGLAALSAAIHTGEIFGSELFNAYCTQCPKQVTDAARDAAIDAIDDKAMCQVMCCCKNALSKFRQVCVQKTLDEADDLLIGTSRYKAEISYNMLDADGPSPFMHRDETGSDTTRRSHRWQTRAEREIDGYQPGEGHVRRPDVIIVKDPLRPPYTDNIRRVVEMKFGSDVEGPGQYDAYEEIARGPENFDVIEESDCDCDDEDGERVPLPYPVPVRRDVKEEAPEESPSLWEIPAWGLVTVLAAVATVALLVSPFEGPAGELASGAGTAAAAARFSAAWRAAFAAGSL